MCLFTDEIKPRAAKKTITCYKTVWAEPTHNYKGMRIYAEIQQFEYKIGKRYKLSKKDRMKSFGRNIDKMADGLDNARVIVHQGFHSYKRFSDAEAYAKIYMSDRMIMLKCEIPEGAMYWTGNKGDGVKENDKHPENYAEYCSSEIKVVAWKWGGSRKWNTTQSSKYWPK